MNHIEPIQARSRITRWVHLLLALIIVHQMVMSAVMQVPNLERGRSGNLWWSFHEYGGLGAFLIVLLFWGWSVVRDGRETGCGEWFPWFSAARRYALWQDICSYFRAALQLRLPAPESSTALPAAIQGIGLLLVTVLAASGTLFWLGGELGGGWPARFRWVEELHGALGNLVWYYLSVHVGAALIHEFFGHRILKPMSPFSRQSPR